MPPPTKRRRLDYRQPSTRSHRRLHSLHNVPSQTSATSSSPANAPHTPTNRNRRNDARTIKRRLNLGLVSTDTVTNDISGKLTGDDSHDEQAFVDTSTGAASSSLSTTGALGVSVNQLTQPVHNLAANTGADISSIASAAGSPLDTAVNDLSGTVSSVGSAAGSVLDNTETDLSDIFSFTPTMNFAGDTTVDDVSDDVEISASSTPVHSALASTASDNIGNAGEILLAALSSSFSSTTFETFSISTAAPTTQARFQVPAAASIPLPSAVSSLLSGVNSLVSTLGIAAGSQASSTSATVLPTRQSSTPSPRPITAQSGPSSTISPSPTISSSLVAGSSVQTIPTTSSPSQLASMTTSSASLLHSSPVFAGNFSAPHTHTLHSSSSDHAPVFASSRAFGSGLASSATSQHTQVHSTALDSHTTMKYAHTTAGVASLSTSTSSAAGNAAPSAVSSAVDNEPPPAGMIAGGVVGGAAGIAILLLLALVFARWYRRRAHHRHRALPASTPLTSGWRSPDTPSSSHVGMAERAGLAPFIIAALPARLRPRSRSGHQQLPAVDEWTGDGSERGFTRLAGRKLPSQFSNGSTNVNPAWHAHWPVARTPSPSAPLTAGFEGGVHGRGGSDGSREESYRDSVPEPADEMLLSPGPQRRITVHKGGPYSMESTLNAESLARLSHAAATSRDAETNPFLPPAPRVYDRSTTPLSFASSAPEDSSHRGSRFAEDV